MLMGTVDFYHLLHSVTSTLAEGHKVSRKQNLWLYFLIPFSTEWDGWVGRGDHLQIQQNRVMPKNITIDHILSLNHTLTGKSKWESMQHKASTCPKVKQNVSILEAAQSQCTLCWNSRMCQTTSIPVPWGWKYCPSDDVRQEPDINCISGLHIPGKVFVVVVCFCKQHY